MRQVVLELPDEVLEKAENEARRRHRSTESLLTETLLDRLQAEPGRGEVDLAKWAEMDLSGLPDALLEAHIRTPVSAGVDARLSELQRRNADGVLSSEERDELGRLLRIVHSSTILKALALAAWKTRHGRLPDQIQADW